MRALVKFVVIFVSIVVGFSLLVSACEGLSGDPSQPRVMDAPSSSDRFAAAMTTTGYADSGIEAKIMWKDLCAYEEKGMGLSQRTYIADAIEQPANSVEVDYVLSIFATYDCP